MKTQSNIEMATATVADVAANFPQSVDILSRYELDYCCQGRKSFVEACRDAEVDAGILWGEILELENQPDLNLHSNFGAWETSRLVTYIVEHHHKYVRNSVPRITELLDKVCLVHAGDQPELEEIRTTFHELGEELLSHLNKEESVLFPAITKTTGIKTGQAATALRMPIAVMEHEHESAGDLIKAIHQLTSNYTVPMHACPTYRLTYSSLKEFEKDLMQHIHLENNILFPRALKQPPCAHF